MLKSLSLKHFTVFEAADLDFHSGLNIIVGENGTGKSQLLKIAYALSFVSADYQKAIRQGKEEFQRSIADKLIQTCKPDALGRLVSRQAGRGRTEVAIDFIAGTEGFAFSFASNSKSEVKLESALPEKFLELPPIFIPTREMLSLFPGFAALYRSREVQFDDTYYDLALMLEAPLLKGSRPKKVAGLLDTLENAMRGKIVFENGRFYLWVHGKGNFEMPLVAEGIRKLAMLTYLIANGSLRENRSTLFWDEPETNLNPRLMAEMAKVLVQLAASGTQVVLATHSLFFLREISIQLDQNQQFARYFALGLKDDQVEISAGDSLEAVDPLVMLDADLEQTDRYLALP
jgi:ABC-type transport system involved in cytochrome c biogenesis ATPase subunit